jgi:hypothetical protein
MYEMSCRLLVSPQVSNPTCTLLQSLGMWTKQLEASVEWWKVLTGATYLETQMHTPQSWNQAIQGT